MQTAAAAAATFIPSCFCVPVQSEMLLSFLPLLGYGMYLNDAILIGAFFYSLFEIDAISNAWYTVIFWYIYGLGSAFQPAIDSISPGADTWRSSCSYTCSAEQSFFYLANNYYAVPDRFFTTSVVFICLLIKWRTNVRRYIFPAAFSGRPIGKAAEPTPSSSSPGLKPFVASRAACFLFPLSMIYLFLFFLGYLVLVLVYRKQSEGQLLVNAAIGAALVAGTQIFDECWRRHLEKQRIRAFWIFTPAMYIKSE